MDRRIFLCANVKFPRGEAGANYVQYIALALKDRNWKVIIIGEGENRLQDFIEEKGIYEYQGIEYDNLKLKDRGVLNFVTYNFLYGSYYKKALERYGLRKEDYVYLYTSSIGLINYVKKLVPKEQLSISIVEWHRPSQFRMNFISPSYIMTRYSYRYIHQHINKIFPISTMLEQYFCRNSCSTLLLPALADPMEYEYSPGKDDFDKIRFIYSGTKSTRHEDAIESMLKAFLLLEDKERSRVELHITGLSRSRILKVINENEKLLADLGHLLVIHSWLEYSELVKLYLKSDFLLLARNNNAVTRANFPSKIPEILCYGVIPVCTDIGDYTKMYLKDGENSIIFEGCSEVNCLRAIRRALHLSKEERLRLRENCRETALNQFNYRAWSDRISDFIME